MDMQVRVSQTCEGCKYAEVVHPSLMPQGKTGCNLLGREVHVSERECSDEQWLEGHPSFNAVGPPR